MNAVRINSAHLTPDGATMIVENVRRVSDQIAIIIDTKGPEIRVTGMSPEFANEAALCLAANGIKAYIFDALRPTPELSFALRTLGCVSGIVITITARGISFDT